MIQDEQTARVVHYFFEWAALASGLLFYRRIRKQQNAPGLLAPGRFAVLVGCLAGAALGNKAAFWLENPHLWAEHGREWGVWLSGQSVIGALLGGWLGVEVGKKIGGVASRTGDDFVRPILLGLVIGRIGCFLAGLHDGTYGLPTALPWAVDFGDGIPRHPTQLYESALALAALATWRRWQRPFVHTTGLTFRVFILAYLLWRIAVDTLKPVPHPYALGLSGLQWLCAAGAAVIILALVRDTWRTRRA